MRGSRKRHRLCYPFWQQEAASMGFRRPPDPTEFKALCSLSTQDEPCSVLTFNPRRTLLFAHFQPKTNPALCSLSTQDEPWASGSRAVGGGAYLASRLMPELYIPSKILNAVDQWLQGCGCTRELQAWCQSPGPVAPGLTLVAVAPGQCSSHHPRSASPRVQVCKYPFSKGYSKDSQVALLEGLL